MEQQLRPALSVPKGKEYIKVNRTLKPVKKGEPRNAELEKDELAIGPFSFDGFPSIFVVGGKSHSQGGTPSNLPENSFIFSKDKSMKIDDEDILESFNKKPKESGYSPAEIARQYNINKFRKVLSDPNSDKMQRETSEDMIKNYNEKLGKLALAQESIKGFPNNVPFVAIPYLESMGIDAAQFVNQGHNQNSESPLPSQEEMPMQKKGGQLKIRITKTPNAILQKGGPTQPKGQEFAYNKEFYTDFANRLGTDISAILPSTLGDQRGMVNNLQGALGANVFGRKDWTSPELFNDFKSRNAWYFEKNPKFDPSKKEDVKDFQQAYNEKAKTMGLKPYFNQGKGSKYSLDSKFGEVTYSVPNLEQKAASPVQLQTQQLPPINQTLPDLQKPNLNYSQPNQDNPFWTEDLINMAGVYGDLTRIKKYMPWQAGYDTVLPDPTFYDPTRELAASAEQSNIAGQALGAFAGPQALSARLSSVQGQGLSNAANILGRYNNMNVGVANQFEQMQTDITNNSNINRANQATSLYDKTVATNQAFDNSKTMARQNFRQSLINSWNNRGNTQALNSMNKQYRVDPTTGFVEFTGVPGELNPNQQSQQAIDIYNDIRSRPGMTDTAATDIFKAIFLGK